jgi:hypothetical protein
MLLFKEKKRERERGRERKSLVGFLFEIGSKTCARITRLLSLSVQTVEEEEDEKRKKRGYILSSSSTVRTAHLAQIQNKKAQSCSGASKDDERRKRKAKEDIYTHTHTNEW